MSKRAYRLMGPVSKHLIYGLRDPRTNEIRYVGRSSTRLRRPRAHSKTAPFELTHKAAWIRQLHDAGLEYEVVVLEQLGNECSKEHINAREIAWIALGREALGKRLTNSTEGGDGFDSEAARKMWASITPEQRLERARKMRRAHSLITPERWREAAQKRIASTTPAQRSAAARKAQASIPPEQRSEKARKANAYLTPEQRRENGRKATAHLTPEQRREIGRRLKACVTPQQIREYAQKARASMTPATRRAQMLKVWRTAPEERREKARELGIRFGKAFPSEQRRQNGIKAMASWTAEQRLERARRAAASKTPQQRQESARRLLAVTASMPYEKRREKALKAWQTRRARTATKAAP